MKKNTKDSLTSYKQLDLKIKHTPPVVHIGAVSGCPLSCAMCNFGNTKVTRMSKDILSKIEPYYKNLEVMSITGSGEPLFADIDYFVEKATENDFVLHMNTSAFNLNNRIADKLLQSKLSIRFSIHAGSEESYRKIMGKPLSKIKENIKYIMEKSKSGSICHDFWFSYVVMKENIDEIEKFLEFTHECGVKSVRFMRLLPNRQTKKGIVFKNRNFTFKYKNQFNNKIVEKFNTRLKDYQKLAKYHRISIEVGSLSFRQKKDYPIIDKINGLSRRLINNYVFPKKGNHGKCVAPWLGQLRISQTGDVRLCCGTPFVIGNINRTSLSDIWKSKTLNRIRYSFKYNKFPKFCGYCKGFFIDNYPKNSFLGPEKNWGYE